MRMKILVCGSIAYDNIMVFRGRFKEHILPEKIHILNVAFLVPDLRREYGGCAGNIAYNLKLLGGDPLIMATVGEDAAPYLERLDALGLPRSQLLPALISFNAGVELGQLTVILAAFLLIGLPFGRRPWYHRRVVVPLSIAIAAIGLFWAVQRGFG